MASSGRIYGTKFPSNMSGGYRLEIDWEVTSQSRSNNRSYVRAKIYLHSLGSGWNIISSANKYGSITINGSKSSFTTSGASLSGNQRRLLHTYGRMVYHNSDGNKSINIKGDYAPNVTISSSGWLGDMYASDTVSLPKIDRGVVRVRAGGRWRQGEVYVKSGGSWRKAEGVWRKVSGSWRRSI